MHIGIDARELSGHPTGVGRHLGGLLSGWQQLPEAAAHRFVLYSHQPLSIHPAENVSVRVLHGAGGTRWEQTVLGAAANADGVDVFFGPGYSAPLRLEMPSVVLVHDVSFVAHPEWFRLREGFRRRTLTRLASRRAKVVLTVSDFARQEIVDRLGLPEARVRRVYPGITRLTDPSRGGAAREPLVLFVGSVFNRRHIPDLIEAFAVVRRAHPEARLEIVGDNRTYPHQPLASIVAAAGLEDAAHFHPWVNDTGLTELYRRASAFAFLSDYEGFGHPPLEALAAGVPGVLLDTAVAREVCGPAALYVRCQLGSIAGALEALLFDRAARDSILDAAPDVLERYSWITAARQTLDVLAEARQ